MRGKRAMDIIGAIVGLVILSPAFLVIFLCLKISSKSPAFFTQERIGKGGRPFKILKFRTMIADSEPDGVPQLAEPDDERLTRIGKFLRAYHIDELPQLVNVLRGDMSFVGYRPERKYFIDQIMAIDPRYEQLYQIRPGVTSYATLYNGYTDTMEKMLRRLELDLYYLDCQTWRFDLQILAKTFLNMLFGKRF